MPPQQFDQSYNDEMYNESYDMPHGPGPMQMPQNMQSIRMQAHPDQMRPSQNMRMMHRGGFNRGGGMGPNMRPQWRKYLDSFYVIEADCQSFNIFKSDLS